MFHWVPQASFEISTKCFQPLKAVCFKLIFGVTLNYIHIYIFTLTAMKCVLVVYKQTLSHNNTHTYMYILTLSIYFLAPNFQQGITNSLPVSRCQIFCLFEMCNTASRQKIPSWPSPRRCIAICCSYYQIPLQFMKFISLSNIWGYLYLVLRGTLFIWGNKIQCLGMPII